MTRSLWIVVLIVLVGLSGHRGLRAQPSADTPPTQTVPVVIVPGNAAQPPATGAPSQQAVPVKEVPSPAAPSHAPEQVEWALIGSYVFQKIKNKSWFAWLTPASSGRVKAWWGFGLAILTAAGVHFSISGSLLDGGGAAITITGVSLDALKDIAWQWASQQGIYDLIVSKSGVKI